MGWFGCIETGYPALLKRYITRQEVGAAKNQQKNAQGSGYAQENEDETTEVDEHRF